MEKTENTVSTTGNAPQKKGFIIAGVAGNVMEWFDYSLYGFFASSIAVKFFPEGDPIVGLLLSFMVFGLGFCTRPLGGIIFGHFGDKIGRKNTLSFTVIMMGLCTFLVGVLPTYEQVGVAAPAILIVLRLLQGVAAGGEWGNVVAFLGEYSRPNNRAFIVSFSMVGAGVGLLMGASLGFFLNSTLSPEALLSWGWRLAFMLGILVAAIGYYMRKGVEETPVFKERKESNAVSKNPLADTFKSYKKNMFIVLIVMGGSMVAYWLILSYMATYINRFLDFPATVGYSLTAITIIIHCLTLPLSGYLADKFGRKPMLLLGSGGILFLSYPLFTVLANTTSYGTMALVVSTLAFIYSLMGGTLPSALSEMFPANVRVTGYGVPYQLASAIFGGTGMMVVTWLISKTDNVMMFPIYMCTIMALAFCTVLFLYKETKDNPYE